MADVLSGRYGSHDHIVLVEKLTGGRILAAPEKICFLNEMWLYGDRTARPAYFVNCVFAPSILAHEHRDNELSIKPGWRHDLLLDFEKKQLVKGKWLKNECISLGEKKELMGVLESLPWIAWAGVTPHGVHGGVYFTDWICNSWSGQIVKWIGEQIEKASYKGPVVIDWTPSVSCNRPSRFLDEFSFWRPKARLNASVVIAEKGTIPERHVRFHNKRLTFASGSIPNQAKRAKALRCRANAKSTAETALEVGETMAWVEKLWTEVPQEAFNPFNEDLQRTVGPRSHWGYERQSKFTIHVNAAWSWEWCWSQKMDFETAKAMIFGDPIFAEILKEVRAAWEKCVLLNKGPRITDTWEVWVERDIERCYEKFGSRFLKERTVDRIKEAAIRTGKQSVTVTEIARMTGMAKSTVSYGFTALQLVCVRQGKKSHFPLPPEWLAAGTCCGGPSLPLPLPVTICVERKDGEDQKCAPAGHSLPNGVKKRKRKRKVMPFEAFWLSIAPPIVESPCPVADLYVKEIENALSAAYSTNPSWRYLVRRLWKDNPNNVNNNLSLSLLLQLVRGCLAADGHVFHPQSELTAPLAQVLGANAPGFMEWLQASGYVVNVSGLAVDANQPWIAWRYYLEGEVRFAWNTIEHCLKGGALEVVYGEPGTGKTQYLAEKLVIAERAGRNCRAGSALNYSARQLRDRLPPGTKVEVKTLHKAYDIPVEVQDLKPRARRLSGDLLIADEVGQLSCDAAGVLSRRWKRGAEVVLSVGVGQNLPIGPGSVGEDLLAWVGGHNLSGCVLKELTENHRVSIDGASGVIDFFRAVQRGDVPDKLGPGMEIVWCDDQEAVPNRSASLAHKLNALCFSPTNGVVGQVNSDVVAWERRTGEFEANAWEFCEGERLVVRDAGAKARQAGLRNGDEVEVAVQMLSGFNPKAQIRVRFGGKEAGLLIEEVERAHARTGHSTQGAESGIGIIGLVPSRATTRRWLYTAVSRCRKRCVLVCTRVGLEACLANNPRRRTCLPTLLDRAAAAQGLAGV
jgi:hypothetical protein